MSRLLLVDDNDGVRLAMSAVLEDEGYLVDTAASFAEGSRKIELAEAPYRAALLDRHLPDRPGTDLVPLLRARHPEALIVLLSGSSGDEVSGDFDAAFDKGGALDELLALLRRVRPGQAR